MAINPQRKTAVSSTTKDKETQATVPDPQTQLQTLLSDPRIAAALGREPRFPVTGFSSNPKSPFEQFFGPKGRSTRIIRGGFAPGSFGSNIQEQIQQLLRGLTSGKGSIKLPSRESLLGPRKADINDLINRALVGQENRFAGLGRSVSGSVPTQARNVLEGTRARETNRAGGEVDQLLAQLGIQTQAFDTNSILQLLQVLGGL